MNNKLKGLKIGALIPSTGICGIVRRFVEMGNLWVQRGAEFFLYDPYGLGPDWLPFYGNSRPFEYLEEEREEEKLDVLICGTSGLLDLLELSSAKLKIIYLLEKKYVKEYTKYFKGSFVIVSVFSDWRDYFPEIDAYTIPGGVNPEHFKARTKLSQGEKKKFTILTYGSSKRASELVIEAFEKLEIKDASLVILSNTNSRLGFFKIFRPSSSRNIQVICGLPDKELPTIYQQADLFVSAETNAIGWSHSVAEAMACSTPIVCTAAGTTDFAKHLLNSIVLPFEDVSAIAGSIWMIYNDRELGRYLAENARRDILNYSWEVVCNKFEEIFQKYGLIK